MDLLDKVRKYESMHIVFWLIKDSCWMLELRSLGAIMIIPTIFIALYILIKTRQTIDFYLNAAILFWISANSYWMLIEFFNNNELRYFAAIPFAFGFLFVGIFYWKTFRSKKGLTQQ